MISFTPWVGSKNSNLWFRVSTQNRDAQAPVFHVEYSKTGKVQVHFAQINEYNMLTGGMGGSRYVSSPKAMGIMVRTENESRRNISDMYDTSKCRHSEVEEAFVEYVGGLDLSEAWKKVSESFRSLGVIENGVFVTSSSAAQEEIEFRHEKSFRQLGLAYD